MTDVAQYLISHQVAVAIVDLAEIVHIADHYHAIKSGQRFHAMDQSGLVEESGQTVEISAMMRGAAGEIEFTGEIADAIDLALTPHRHGGKGEHAVQSEIDVGFMAQILGPGWRARIVIEVQKQRYFL